VARLPDATVGDLDSLREVCSAPASPYYYYYAPTCQTRTVTPPRTRARSAPATPDLKLLRPWRPDNSTRDWHPNSTPTQPSGHARILHWTLYRLGSPTLLLRPRSPTNSTAGPETPKPSTAGHARVLPQPWRATPRPVTRPGQHRPYEGACTLGGVGAHLCGGRCGRVQHG
jgi:hypothetical protein